MIKQLNGEQSRTLLTMVAGDALHILAYMRMPVSVYRNSHSHVAPAREYICLATIV